MVYLAILLLVVSVSFNIYFAYSKKNRNVHDANRAVLSIWKVDMMTEEEYNVIAFHKEVIDPLDKWISFLIAKKFEETLLYKESNDFFRAQWAVNVLSLFLAQIRSIKTKAESTKQQ